MAKQPLIGRVKTRLARDIGHAEALRFFRSASESLIRRVGRDPRWQTVIAVSPDRAVHERGIWPDDLPRVGQGEGDLGHRMGSLFRDLPPGPVIIIGADIPAIGKKQVAAAFDALGRSDTVIGPAEDGGYWLLALNGPAPEGLLDGMRWSHEETRNDLERQLSLHGMERVRLLRRLRDVDEASDLKRG